jgi:hypothetical protein
MADVHRRAGDRWLAGEPVGGVAFAHNDSVEIAGATGPGRFGTIALLMGLEPEPTYLVELGGGGERRFRQSQLRRAT